MDFREINNRDLYEMCRQGDKAAWQYIYNYVGLIVASPRWRHTEAREDLVQAIVCRLCAGGLEQVREPDAFRAYVRSVTVNHVLDGCKKVRPILVDLDDCPRQDLEPGAELLHHAADPEEIMLRRDHLRVLNRAIATLDARCRDLLIVHIDYLQGRYSDLTALAASMNMKLQTLSSAISRCRKKLRDIQEVKDWLAG